MKLFLQSKDTTFHYTHGVTLSCASGCPRPEYPMISCLFLERDELEKQRSNAIEDPESLDKLVKKILLEIEEAKKQQKEKLARQQELARQREITRQHEIARQRKIAEHIAGQELAKKIADMENEITRLKEQLARNNLSGFR